MPQVSVIVPTHNDEMFISKAIDSVLKQTYQDYEIIVIDDGSTDNTGNILKNYEDERIKYLYQDNQGVSAARNLGIEKAQSDLISFLDADDYFLPDHLQQQVNCLELKPSLGMVSSGWRRVDEEDNLLSENKPWQVLPKLNIQTWLISRPVLPSAITIRKKWLEKVKGFKKKFVLAQDIDLILRLAISGCQADWSGRITSCYRSSRKNATNNTIKQAKFFDLVFDDFFTQENLPESVAQLENQARYSYLKWLGWRLYRTGRFSIMTNYLCRSLSYSSNNVTQTICDWIEYFENCSLDDGVPLNAFALSSSKEWKELTRFLFVKRAWQDSKNIIQSWKNFSQQNNRFIVSEDNDQLVQNKLKLAEDFSKKHKFKDAINTYREVLNLQPNNWNTHYKLGYVLFKNKMWKESVLECLKSIELKPDFLWSYYNMARSLKELKQYDESIASYFKALEISFKPEVKQDLEKLLEYLVKLSIQHPQNDIESDNKHHKLLKFKQDLLLQDLEFKSNRLREYQELGDAFSKKGKLDDALNCYYKASEIQPDTWNIHQKIAHILLKQRKWQESIIECQKVIELKPDFLWSYYNMGRNLQQTGKWREAIKYYLKALTIDNKLEIKQELNLLLNEKIASYQENLKSEADNLTLYQELLDLKGKIKVLEAKKGKKRSEQLLSGFSKNIRNKQKILCLMFGMKHIDYIESINFVLHHMYENKIYPVVFTDSLETELLFKNNVVFEYFPLSEKPVGCSNSEWKRYYKNRVCNLIKEWSPQQVLNFNDTLNKELSQVLLSIS